MFNIIEENGGKIVLLMKISLYFQFSQFQMFKKRVNNLA